MSTYREKHGFSDIKAIDGHLHFIYKRPVAETLEILEQIKSYFDYDGLALMSMSESSNKGKDPFNTIKGLYLREKLGEKSYVFGSLFHWYDERDTADNYLEQVKAMHAMGYDGVKMLEGKPKMRKMFGRPLDHEILDKFYGYCEENEIPIMLHLSDPSYMWDITRVSEYAIKAGWFCDETFPTRDQLFDEIEGVLTKFPRLHLTLAHLYNRGENVESASKFLDTWENVAFDLTPGDWYAHFMSDWEGWKQFVLKYRKRLSYGTDTYNVALDGKTPEEVWAYRPHLVRAFLEGAEPFVYNDTEIRPYNLDKETVSMILRDNVVRKLGECHRKADYAMAAAECARLRELLLSGAYGSALADYVDMEKASLDEMEAFFQGK